MGEDKIDYKEVNQILMQDGWHTIQTGSLEVKGSFFTALEVEPSTNGVSEFFKYVLRGHVKNLLGYREDFKS